jgi:hypothetical protein
MLELDPRCYLRPFSLLYTGGLGSARAGILLLLDNSRTLLDREALLDFWADQDPGPNSTCQFTGSACP